MTWWLSGAQEAAKSSVGDPGATRTIYAIVVVLVLIAAGLGYFAFRFWQRTRPGVEFAGPTRRSERGRNPRAPVRGDTDGHTVTRRPDARRPVPRAPQSGQPASRRPERRDRPVPHPERAPSDDPFDDDPWWDTRAPRPRPKPSLRDPLL